MGVGHVGSAEVVANSAGEPIRSSPESPPFEFALPDAADRWAPIAAPWIFIAAFVGLAAARSSGVVPPWVGAVVGGGSAFLISVVAITRALIVEGASRPFVGAAAAGPDRPVGTGPDPLVAPGPDVESSERIPDGA
jgi:hypothetical protein